MILKVSQNIARAATSYQTMLEALSQTGGPAPTESVLLEVIGKVIIDHWIYDDFVLEGFVVKFLIFI